MLIPRIVTHIRQNHERMRFVRGSLPFFLLFVVMLLVAFYKESIFPPNYFFDSYTILDIIESGSDLTPGASYSSTAYIYDLLGINSVGDVKFTLPVIGFSAYLLLFLIAINKANANICSASTFAVISFFSVMAMVYLTTFSKDLFIVFLNIAFIILIGRRRGLVAWIFLALLYSYYFRNYWALIILLFLTLRTLQSITKSPTRLMITLASFFLLLAVLFPIILSTDLNGFRQTVNESRLDRGVGEDAKSMITAYFPLGFVPFEAANAIVTWLFLMFPLPLLFSLSPTYWLIFLFFSICFFQYWKNLFRYFSTARGDKVSGDIYLFTLSMLLVQSIFEPDYGSYVRHLSPFYPFLIYTMLFPTHNRNIVKV